MTEVSLLPLSGGSVETSMLGPGEREDRGETEGIDGGCGARKLVGSCNSIISPLTVSACAELPSF